MLAHLHVKNLALIEEIEVEFGPGLNILTGETGAGKSILLGSMQLILGAKTSKNMIRENASYALVELLFQVENEKALETLKALDICPEDGQVLLSRKIMDGRSINKINGETSTVGQMKAAAACLLDIHGQHEHQSLLYQDKQLAILDAYGKEKILPAKEKVSLAYAQIIHIFMKIMTPFIFIINGLTNVVLFILRVDPNDHKRAMTENELRTIVNVSHEDGVIESEEKEMIYNVVDLGDAKAKDVMVPRVHVTFADVNCTYEELIDIFREDKFTRLPIYEDTTDNVIGTINMKDLLLYDYGNTKEFHIRDIMREAYFTYEYKNISELLVEMRQASFNIAIVLDEYGETSGLITLEDILEEIVGEIHDEYDENEEDFVHKISDKEYLVEGSVNLDDFNDHLELNLESEEYDSLGGFIIEHLDRLPEIGDGVTTEDDIHLVVEKLDKNRIESVHLYLPEPKPEDEEGDED